MLEIRPATTEDKESIQQIYLFAVGSNAILDQSPWDELIGAQSLIVARREGQIIGFGGIDVKAQEQVKWLYLLPAHQGLGIGSEILRRLEAIGWKAGLSSLRLHSAPDAVKFYRRHGYKTSQQADQITHDHEGVAMVKDRSWVE